MKVSFSFVYCITNFAVNFLLSILKLQASSDAQIFYYRFFSAKIIHKSNPASNGINSAETDSFDVIVFMPFNTMRIHIMSLRGIQTNRFTFYLRCRNDANKRKKEKEKKTAKHPRNVVNAYSRTVQLTTHSTRAKINVNE